MLRSSDCRLMSITKRLLFLILLFAIVSSPLFKRDPSESDDEERKIQEKTIIRDGNASAHNVDRRFPHRFGLER